MTRPPPISTLFPYTTLFRSNLDLGLAFTSALEKVQRGGKSVLERKNRGILDLRLAPFKDIITIKRSEEHTSELQSRVDLVCRLLLEKKKKQNNKKKQSK